MAIIALAVTGLIDSGIHLAVVQLGTNLPHRANKTEAGVMELAGKLVFVGDAADPEESATFWNITFNKSSTISGNDKSLAGEYRIAPLLGFATVAANVSKGAHLVAVFLKFPVLLFRDLTDCWGIWLGEYSHCKGWGRSVILNDCLGVDLNHMCITAAEVIHRWGVEEFNGVHSHPGPSTSYQCFTSGIGRAGSCVGCLFTGNSQVFGSVGLCARIVGQSTHLVNLVLHLSKGLLQGGITAVERFTSQAVRPAYLQPLEGSEGRVRNQEHDPNSLHGKHRAVMPIAVLLMGYCSSIWGWWRIRRGRSSKHFRIGALALLGGAAAACIGGVNFVTRIF